MRKGTFSRSIWLKSAGVTLLSGGLCQTEKSLIAFSGNWKEGGENGMSLFSEMAFQPWNFFQRETAAMISLLSSLLNLLLRIQSFQRGLSLFPFSFLATKFFSRFRVQKGKDAKLSTCL